jgi:hypothetical protein
MTETILRQEKWTAFQKICFRFFFIYLFLFIAPWTWFEIIPGIDYITGFYYQFMDWLVGLFNSRLFHIKDQLIPINGSGDTSFGWAQLCTFLLLAAVGTVAWTLADKKRTAYKALNYWLCLIVRYNLVIVCCVYGFVKIFNLQMPFPAYSQLATPLGDLLPMRLSWLFLGYSHLYQGFSGALELTAGLLLLYRRTATLGSLLAAGVFLNVAILNLSYDIPVKLYSINIFLLCIVLLATDRKRLVNFFLLNKAAVPSVLYEYTPGKRWMRITKIVLKLVMIVMSFGYYAYESIGYYYTETAKKVLPPLQAGMYDVPVFAVNRDTLPPLATDPTRWLNLAIENDGNGSVNITDTAFRIRYNRSYFAYEADTVQKLISFKRYNQDTSSLFTMRYDVADSNTIRLWGLRNKDSLYIVLKKSKRHFQLAEKQFHWLSESNR